MQGFYPALQGTFSPVRLHAYHDGDAHPLNLDVTARYAHNMAVAMRLSPSLHIFEVALRNNMHKAFSAKHMSPTWYDTAHILGFVQVGQIALARTSLRKAGKGETPDRLVAELTLGFWAGLFSNHYESYWRANPDVLTAIFPHAPRYMRKRHTISQLLQPLRALRNRVSHWERVAHLPDLAQRKTDIDNMVRSLCPAASALLRHIDPFNGALDPAEFNATRGKVQRCFVPAEIQTL